MVQSPMSGSPRSTDRVRAAAAALGLPIDIRVMPQSTRTAEEAAAACGTTVARIVKSLLFRKAVSGEPVLILASGANRVDEAVAAAVIGDRLERLDARAVRAVTGFAIGGVAPIGSLTRLDAYMDADLMAFETVWAAAGAPQSVFEATPQALAAAAEAKIISIS